MYIMGSIRKRGGILRYVRPGFLWQGSKPGRRERQVENGKMLENLMGKYIRVRGSNFNGIL